MYAPTLPPAAEPDNDDVRELADWVVEELEKIEKELVGVEAVTLKTENVNPSTIGKPRNGMVIFADGTNFNPGSGEGFYGWYAGAWNFLG